MLIRRTKRFASGSLVLAAAVFLAALVPVAVSAQQTQPPPELMSECLYSCSSNKDCSASHDDTRRYCAEATSAYPDTGFWECVSANVNPDAAWEDLLAGCRKSGQ